MSAVSKEEQINKKILSLKKSKDDLDKAQKEFWKCLAEANDIGVTQEKISQLTGFSRANVIYHLNKIKNGNPFFIGKATASRGRKK